MTADTDDDEAVTACALGCLAEALEAVAFALVEPADAAFPWDRDDVVWAEIELFAPISRLFVLGATPDALDPLASDAWGRDTPSDDPDAAFAAELANIVAGQLLAKLHPDRSPRLGLPRLGRGRRPAAPGAIGVCVDVGTGLVGLAITHRCGGG